MFVIKATPASVRAMLLVLFAVSGFSGLIYESIWSHYLKLMLGHAAFAQSLVLAIFMGGMALGAWLASRHSERWRRPLLAYALIEAVVGLFAFVFHPLFVRALDLLYLDLIPRLDGSTSAELWKWGIAAGLILPQSVLLGMTFPLMSAAVLRLRPEEPGAGLAVLYFTNSIGAAVGALASGFLLIPRAGLPGTISIAGALNILLALFVWSLARGAPAGSRPVASETAQARGGLPLLVLWAALLTGAASFIYEIGWIRMLSLVLGTTVQAFELMLSAFIFGLAFGGLWIRRRLDGLDSPLRFAGKVQILMGLAALVTLPLYGATFDFMAFLLRTLDKTDGGYALFQIGSHAIALAIMLPATLLAGMTLPLFTYALIRERYGERSIGRVYAANTVGAILGVVIAVHVVMPAIGTKGAVVLGAAVDILLGLGLLALYRGRLASLELPAGAVVSATMLAVVIFTVDFDPRRTASGVYRHGRSRLAETSEVVFHRDGKTATVDLVRERDGTMTITTNGKADAEVRTLGSLPAADEITMVMLGALPLTLHPRARVVANIGMGSGVTTHTLLGAATLERVDTIEIEPAIVEAARGFGRFVERAYSDPRSRIHIADAKTFFSKRRERYDIIISEPSNPWVSGVANLFSSEFYGRISSHLAPDGLAVQWLQLYETNLELLASVFKALDAHFADYVVFNTDNANILIVAGNGGQLKRLNGWVFEQPLLERDLARVGLHETQDFEMRRVGSRALLHPLFAGFEAPANSDYSAYLSYAAPRSRFLGETAVDLTRLHVAPVPVLEMLDPYVKRDMLPTTADPSFAPSQVRVQAVELVAGLAPRWAPVTAGLGRATFEAAPLDLKLEACPRTAEDERELRHELASLAAATNPYLRGEELTRMWDYLDDHSCYERLSSETRRWLRLHRSVARRDGKTMTELAASLLDSGAERLSERDRIYLLTAGLTGALARGDGREARAFAAAHVPSDPPEAALPFYVRLLLGQL